MSVIIFWASIVLLIIILAEIILNIRQIVPNIKINTKKNLTLFILILVAALLIREFLPHYHAVTYDEHYMIRNAKNIIEGSDVLSVSHIPSSLLFVLPFSIFGISSETAIQTNIFFSILSIITLFYTGKSINGYAAGLWAALFIAFDNTNISWSITSYDPIFGMFFMLLSILIISWKDKRLTSLALASFAYSCMIRPEYIILFPAISIYIKKNQIYLFSQDKLKVLYPLLFLFIVLYYIRLRIQPFFEYGSSNNFSISLQVIKNIADVSIYPVILTLTMIVLLFYLKKHLQKLKFETTLLLSSIILMHLFYSLLVNFEQRYIVLSVSLMALLSGILLAKIKIKNKTIYRYGSILLLIMIILPWTTTCYSLGCQESWKRQRVLEKKVPEIVEHIFPGCVIVTQFPEIFVTSQIRTLNPYKTVISDIHKKDKCILFYEGYLEKAGSKDQAGYRLWLQMINNSFSLEPYYNLSLGKDKDPYFTLHRIIPR